MTGEGSIEQVLAGEARWNVTCADCLDVLPTLADKSVDAVVTDPPYGINWSPRVNHRDSPWRDAEAFDPAPWLSIGRWHLFWGANYFATRLPLSEGWATWVKRPIDGCDFTHDARTYSTTEMAWSDWGKSRFYVHVWDGGLRQGDQASRLFLHPSQKPVELMTWCIPGGSALILDPFAGSGTTGVAALRLGRRVILIEREPKWAELCRERLRAEESGSTLAARRAGQVPMFGGER